MIAYFKADADKLVQASLEHVQLTVSALFFALVFAFILTGLLYFLPKLREVSVYTSFMPFPALLSLPC